MRNFYTLLLALTLIAPAAVARQQPPTPTASHRNYTGIKGGINFSKIRNLNNASTFIGAHGGFYTLYMQSERFGIQPEIQYSLQGATFEHSHLFMHYVVVPVMLKFFPAPAFSLQAGPYAGYLLSSKVETDSYPAQYTGKGQDYGFAYGLTIGDEGKFTVSARHHVGLSGFTSNKGSAKNQVFQIAIGVCISRK
ncbi:PorT family protein [Pontibacter sp. 172403-2]|uniref:porin family protein n=1 Tax=Pontibacter rufus TaxID=2791028 RepID=UPI0018AF8D0D|nr:porin family protein [Pontibacter sp. 172403-2]MBF9255539.1 PorT family protein [Pontibacter sp. 172403-2]